MSSLFSVWMNLKIVRDEVTYRQTYGLASALFFLLRKIVLANVDPQVTKNHSG